MKASNFVNLEDVTQYAGDSNEVLMVEFKEVDFLMSCPPYADLENTVMIKGLI
jgi:hypothetical protein